MSSASKADSVRDGDNQSISEESRGNKRVAVQLPKECSSRYLLEKNTESFRCLAQVLLSSSSLMKNRLFVFPPLENPGIEEAFDFVELAPSYDNIGVEKYKNMCKDLGIVPLSHIIQTLGTPELNLKFYGLTSKQMQALTETLKGNVYVETLNLEENFLTTEMVAMLSSMLEENGAVSIMKLRHCYIGDSGAGTLNDALSNSQFLSELDLSCNGLGDNGLRLMMKGLCETPSLNKLNLSRNGLTEDCAEALEQILLENKTITELDLSWNGFYTGPGNKKLFNGLLKNDCITKLNMSWNGISTRPAVVPIAKFVRHSENLQFLDLSNNRLTGPSFKAARAGIAKNVTLTEVRIGNNPLLHTEGKEMVNAYASKLKDPLRHVDMENIYLEKDAIPLLNTIKSSGRTITIGGILSNYNIKGPNVRKLLFDRCRYILQKPKKKKARKDFAHLVLTLPDKPIPVQEFETLIKKKKMKKLDKDIIKELVVQFPAKRKRIDGLEMKTIYKQYYPDASLPPEKSKTKKKGRGRKGKKYVQEDEVEVQVHDLEVAPEGDVQAAPSLDAQVNPEADTQGAKEKTLKDQEVSEKHLPDPEQRTVVFNKEVIAYNAAEEKGLENNEDQVENTETDKEKEEETELRTVELETDITPSFANKEIY